MATCVPQHAPYYAHSPPPQEQNNRQEMENRLLPGLIQNALQQLEFYSASNNTSYSAAAVQLLGAISSAVFPTGTHRSARRRKLSRPFHGFADTKEVFVVEGVDGLGLVEKAYQQRLNSSSVFSGILARSASISLPKGGIRVSKYSWTWTMSAFALPGSSCWEREPDLQVSLTSRAW